MALDYFLIISLRLDFAVCGGFLSRCDRRNCRGDTQEGFVFASIVAKMPLRDYA
jgi:hypothetical protein